MAVPFSFILLPVIIGLLFLSIKYTIKKARQKVNAERHVILRLLALFISIGLIFLWCYAIEGNSAMLGAIYFSFYFACVWALYLLIETISLFIVKQNKLATSNLLILALTIFIVAIVFYQIG